MNAATAAFVAIRLMAIYWAIRSFEAWGQLLTLFVPDLPWDEVNRSSVALTAAIPGILQGAIAIALWAGARRLSNVVSRSAPTSEEHASRGWETAVLAVAGLVIAVSALPGLAGTVYRMSTPEAYGFALNASQLSELRADLIAKAGQALLGLALCIGSRPVAEALRKIRER